MAKPLCKMKKSERLKKTLRSDHPDAEFICKKCGRAADSKKRLCKPKRIKDQD